MVPICFLEGVEVEAETEEEIQNASSDQEVQIDGRDMPVNPPKDPGHVIEEARIQGGHLLEEIPWGHLEEGILIVIGHLVELERTHRDHLKEVHAGQLNIGGKGHLNGKLVIGEIVPELIKEKSQHP